VVFALAAGVCGQRRRFRHVTGRGIERLPRAPAFAGGFLEDWLQARARLSGGSPGCETTHNTDPPIPGPGSALAAVRLKASVVREGHGDVCGFADLHRAREAGRSDANDRRRDFIHLNRFADDSRIAAETVLPVTVRDDGDRLSGGLVVLRCERTS